MFSRSICEVNVKEITPEVACMNTVKMRRPSPDPMVHGIPFHPQTICGHTKRLGLPSSLAWHLNSDTMHVVLPQFPNSQCLP
jgi:hypothetical protein